MATLGKRTGPKSLWSGWNPSRDVQPLAFTAEVFWRVVCALSSWRDKHRRERSLGRHPAVWEKHWLARTYKNITLSLVVSRLGSQRFFQAWLGRFASLGLWAVVTPLTIGVKKGSSLRYLSLECPTASCLPGLWKCHCVPCLWSKWAEVQSEWMGIHLTTLGLPGHLRSV